jgi:thiamine-monophosphate kinase
MGVMALNIPSTLDKILRKMAKRMRTIEDIGEFGFIRSILNGCIVSKENVICGIGDDCAVIGPYKGSLLLITTDLLVEGVHFLPGKISPIHLGEKAVAVNLSDIAAMGGAAMHLLVSLAIPPSTPIKTVHSLYSGIKSMCRRYGINLIGGDTSSSLNKLFINIAAIGEVLEGEELYRNGARPGDAVYVTETLGDAAAGLEILKGSASAQKSLSARLIKAQNRPVPLLEVGRKIAESHLASAMIDLSDGLLSDLNHICIASNTGAFLLQASLPLSDDLKKFCKINKLDPYKFVLTGGEDYRLLVTVPDKNIEAFQGIFKNIKSCQVHRIGQITEETGIRIVRQDGTEESLRATGFDHFYRS